MKGFTFIDVLVGTVIMLIVFSGILGAYQLGLKVANQSQARITATALANQKIEAVRNLAYQDVGTIGGVPPGIVSQDEVVLRNNLSYTIKTTIVYIDDPFDLLAPADALSTDYKRVKVKVSWAGRFGGNIALITDVAPRGVETSIGGGTLSLNVFDAQGIGVGQASAHIVNSQANPAIDATYQTDSYGKFVLPGVPPSVENYRVSVSKSGYSQERTYGIDELDTPLKPHASVYKGQVTEMSFSIDKLSAMEVETRGGSVQGYPTVSSVPFTLTGSKLIGQNEGKPVYKYSKVGITNNAGEITLSNMEWDSYSFFVDKQQTGLDLTGIEVPPGTVVSQPVNLLPNTTLSARLVLEAENSLLVIVKNAVNSQAIFGASARLLNSTTGYDETRPTDENGQTFFIPLESGSYSLEVQMVGYQPQTATVSVSGTISKTMFLSTQ